MKYIVNLFVLFVTLLASSAQAHKLNLFAYEEGQKILVEAYFSDGIIPKGAKVLVNDDAGKQLTEGVVDAEGVFQFPVGAQTHLQVIVDAGMGHVARATLKGGDITSLEVEAGESPVNDDIEADSELAVVVKKAVAQANRPLAREIAELKNKARTSDIIGGIGFIVGIMGLFAYLQARKQTRG